jgi:hypothetical protein
MTGSAIPGLPGLASPIKCKTSGLKVLAQNLLRHHEHGRECHGSRRTSFSSPFSMSLANTTECGSSTFCTDLTVKERSQTCGLALELRLEPLALLALLIELVGDIESS